MLTTEQAAKRLGITESLVRRYCREGRIGRKFGRNYIITEAEIEAFKNKERRPGRPKTNGATTDANSKN